MTLFSPEFGIPFELLGPDGTRVVFNDDSDPDNVGVLTNITGLDSAEVRESAEDLVEFDGGVQGPNWYGQRPVVLEGLIYGHDSRIERAEKLDKIMRASSALRADARLSWTPSGGVPVFINVRRSQPLRIEGGWNKTFQMSLKAADPRIYSVEQHTISGTVEDELVVENAGNATAWPIYQITGEVHEPEINNVSAESKLSFDWDLEYDDVLVVDTLRRTVNLGSRKLETRQNLFVNPHFVGSGAPLSTVDNSNMLVDSGFLLIGKSAGYSQPIILVSKIDAAPGVVPGEVVTVSFDHVRAYTSGFGYPTVRFYWYDDEDNLIPRLTGDYDEVMGTQTLKQSVTGEWRRFSASVEAPEETASLYLEFGILPVHDPTVSGYALDRLVIEKNPIASPGDYFDGDTEPDGEGLTGQYEVAWDSTPNNSTSTATILQPGVDPNAELVSRYEWLNFAESRWDGLSPGGNLITMSWNDEATPDMSLQVRWRDTWL